MPRGAEYEAIKAEIEQSMKPQEGEPEQEQEPETLAAEGDQQQDAEQEQGEEIRSINQIPELLGITPEQFYELEMRLSEGQDPVKLGTIKDRLQEIEQQRQAIEAQRAQLSAQQQEFQQRAAQAQQAQQTVTKEMAEAAKLVNAIDGQQKISEKRWEKMEATDPGTVALERQKFAQAKEAAVAQYNQARAQAQQQQGMAMHQWMQRQNQQLMSAIPDWSNTEKRSAIQSEIRDYATKRGFSEADLRRIDARQVLLLRDAMEAEKMRNEGKKAFDEVAKKPPVVPRSARNAAKQADKARIAELEQRARETGRQSDQLAAARAIIGR